MREGPSRTCGERLARRECVHLREIIKYIFKYINEEDFFKILKNINMTYHMIYFINNIFYNVRALCVFYKRK